MFKRMSVVFSGLAIIMMTVGAASAQTATEKTKTAVKNAEDVTADAATTAAVKTKLLADTKVGGLGINVDTKDNVVTLTGKVRSAAERTEALRLARTTTGVKNVVSKLVVDPNYKGVTDKDDKAMAEVKEDTKVAAEKTKGTTGKAVDATEKGAKKTGEAIEKGTKATVHETKKVAKETGANITDASITSEVKTKFLGDTKVPGLDINVDTNDHVVTLTGTVKNAAAKAEAIRLAKTTTGVHRVVDKLTIQQ